MFAFIILHYLAEEMTCECINRLLELFESSPIHIVVVDNGSSNGSGARIRDKYAGHKHITVLLNEENLGFARGNNIGYKWARENLSPDYMIIMNNDVLIEDTDFLNKIPQIESETAFHVLGPDIYASKADRHQNPIRMKPRTQEEVKRLFNLIRKWLLFYPLHHYRKKIKNFFKKNPPASKAQRCNERLINPVLHGACFIFSRKFIEAESVPFHPGTFLFFEEDILHYLCTQKGYRMVYDPDIAVNHLEDVSTNLRFKNEYRRAKMKDLNLMKSAGVLMKLMEQKNV